MRLTETEKKVILESVENLDPKAEIFVFGSRALDHLRGGDIDLLVLSEHLGILEKAVILAEIKKILGDQKIDLKICHPQEKETDAFVSHILQTAKPLKR